MQNLATILGATWWVAPTLLFYGICRRLFGDLWTAPPSRDRWIHYMRNNSWSEYYREQLGHMLTWIDERLTPELHDPDLNWKPHEIRAAWSKRLLNFSLLLAVAYPILSLVLYWAVTNADGRVHTLVVIAGQQTGWSRAAALGGVGFAIGCAVLALRAEILRNRTIELVAYGLAFAAAAGIAIAIVLAGNLAGAGAFAGVFAVAVIFAGTMSGPVTARMTGSGVVTGAVAMGLAGATSFALAVPGTIYAVAAVAAALGATGAQEWLGRRTGLPVATLVLYCLLVFAALAVALRLGEPAGPATDSLILFLGILPILNALTDFLSFGLTRVCLRRGLAGRMWRKATLDAVGGVTIFFLLGACIILAIDNMRWPDGSALVNLAGLFADLRENPHRYWWLYFTLLLALIPTVLHGAVALFGTMIHLWPGLRRFIVDGLDGGGKGDDVAGRLAVWALCWSMTISFALPVITLVYLFAYRGILGGWVLDAFECFAQLVGAIPSS